MWYNYLQIESVFKNSTPKNLAKKKHFQSLLQYPNQQFQRQILRNLVNPNPWLRECPKVVLNMTTTTTATGTTSRILNKKNCAIGRKYRFYFTDFDRLLIYATINTLYFVWSSFMNLFILQFIDQLYITMNGSSCIDKIFHAYIHYTDYMCTYSDVNFIYTYSEVGVEWYKTWKSDLKSAKCSCDEHISQHPCKKLQCDQMCFGSVVCNQVLNTNQNLNAASVNLGSNIYLVISLLFFLFFFWSGTLAALVASEYHNKNSWMSHAIS